MRVSTHSRPKRRLHIVVEHDGEVLRVSTHSRPKAAALFRFSGADIHRFQLTAARRRLPPRGLLSDFLIMFQLTAARRRLLDEAHDLTIAMLFQLTAARRRLHRR